MAAPGDGKTAEDNDSSDDDDRSDLSGVFDDDTEEGSGSHGGSIATGSWNCIKCKHGNSNTDATTDFGEYCAACGQRRDAFAQRSVSDVSDASTLRS